MKYLVLELQTMADGSVANLLTSHNTKDDAESKYHAVLSYAAVSELPAHAAVMLTSEGGTIKHEVYIHAQEGNNE